MPRLARLAAVAAATGALLLGAVPASAVEPGGGLSGTGFLNIHQCAYNSQNQILTTLLPNSNTPAFTTGTGVTPAPDTALNCGPGTGTTATDWELFALDSGSSRTT
ncbi:hypothetical protein [Streptomyces wedmorensis]